MRIELYRPFACIFAAAILCAGCGHREGQESSAQEPETSQDAGTKAAASAETGQRPAKVTRIERAEPVSEQGATRIRPGATDVTSTSTALAAAATTASTAQGATSVPLSSAVPGPRSMCRELVQRIDRLQQAPDMRTRQQVAADIREYATRWVNELKLDGEPRAQVMDTVDDLQDRLEHEPVLSPDSARKCAAMFDHMVSVLEKGKPGR